MKSGDILASKYRLVQRIGAGGMGEVWSGENLSTGVKVALKLIIPGAPEGRTPDLRERLIREAKACWKLSHRNIVQIFDVGATPEGDPFLVLELLRGQTLAELLKDTRRIEPAMAARIGIEIANALTVAHGAKIIHRDLKPANIFLHHEEGMPEDRFTVKVLDFGVAKNLEGTDGPATVTNVTVGSPAYMSPEQVGMSKDLDPRTDLWSLGVVLYEMLAGVRPFVGSIEEVIRQVVLTKVKKPPPPSSRVRSVPPELDEIVARCMEPDRTLRYASASELALALASVAETSRSMRFPLPMPAPSAPGSQQRAPTWPGPDVAPPPSAARAPMPSKPLVDESDSAATLPMQGRARADLKQVRASAPTAPDQGSTGTQVLSPNQPIASPAPAWKQEMDQWRATRQSSANLDEEAAQGGTQALDPEVVQRAAAGDRAGTTSTIGAFSQPTGSYASPGLGGASGAKSRRKRNSGMLFALMGVGVVSALAIVAIIVLNVSGEGSDPKPASSAAPTASPVKEVVSAVAPAPTPKPVAPQAPTAQPSAAPPSSTQPPTTSTAAPTGTGKALPAGWCIAPGGRQVKCDLLKKSGAFNPTAP